MPRFFVNQDQVLGDKIIIDGTDVNHISRVLRMKRGEELSVSDGAGRDYFCTIDSIEPDSIMLKIENSWDSYSELPVKLTLFQGLPKADKMELIIQKTVELGVNEIVPVSMSRCVVKLDDRKAGKKTARWQSISESAAKQAGRGIIPEIKEPMSFKQALSYAGEMDAILLPYENAEGIAYTREVISELKKLAASRCSGCAAACKLDPAAAGLAAANDLNPAAESAASDNNNPTGNACESAASLRIAIFIGPEGGFADDEIEKAVDAGAKIITLGKRILRTETAGLAMMSILMYELESD